MNKTNSRVSSLVRFLPSALFGGVVLAGPVQGQIAEDFKLLATDGAAGHELGSSTGIADGIVAVGARRDAVNGTNSGSAYLFDAFTGAQLAKLVPGDGAPGDEFGNSIAISGGIVVVGAHFDDGSGANSGSAYIFDASTGVELFKLVPNDGAAGDEFGFAVAIGGGIVAVGANRDDDNGADSGSVYLFDASSGLQLAKLLPDDGGVIANFGESLDIDDGVLAVGAHGDDQNGPLSGAAYLFDVSSGAQLLKLLPLDGGSNDFFGSSIAIDGGVVAVGAWADSLCFDHSGSAYLFDASSGSQIAKLIPSDCHDRDHFGIAVAIDAGIVAIGADGDDDHGFNSGAAYLFDASSGVEVTKVLASDGDILDEFGSAIAIENGIIVVGVPRDDDLGSASGSAYVVDRHDGVGTSYCFGDGSGAGCPCGNFGALGHGCAHSSGAQGARLDAYASASVANDDLILRALNSRPSVPGLFFQGTGQFVASQGVPFGDGIRCVGGSVVRLERVTADAQGTAVTSLSIATQGGVMAGQTLYYQWWYRSPAGPCGSGFNLSNAVEILWVP